MIDDPNRLGDLRASARGWHGVQLAVLGFIGLCGVLEKGGDNPRWLQIIAGLLVLFALLLACVATGLVASAAWPLYSSGRVPTANADADDAGELARTGRRLRLGIGITFLAVAVTALAATSSWWPRGASTAGLLEVTSNRGLACGELRDSGRPGVIAITTGGRELVLSLSDVLAVRPVSECR
ncbi:MAG: hypothetical protein ABJC62_09920 [Frankiaceae bacterium]